MTNGGTSLTLASGGTWPDFFVRREATPVYAAIIALGLFCFICIQASPILYRGSELNQIWIFFESMAALGIVTRRAGWLLLGEFAELFGLFMLISLGSAFASAILAMTDLPLADRWLESADLALGFRWLDIMQLLRPHPEALNLLSYAYASLTFQPVILLGLLCVLGQFQEAWRFVTAWSVALLITIAVFPFVPGVGNVFSHHIAVGTYPGVRVMSAWEYPRILEAFRNGQTVLGAAALEGIVTFPSFHTAGAVLLAWGFGTIRWLRLPMMLVNAAMIVSAVAIGGHYIIDIFAGIFVAYTSMRLFGRSRVARTVGRSPGSRSGSRRVPAPR